MAFSNFYMDPTGADNNAGSVIAAAASVTSTNGSWDITADTFIATGGTPFSGVNVGDWASIYVDGGTVTTYVAQVTALHAAGLGVVLSTTAKYGTKPSASATARSCKIGGSWRSEQVLAAGGFAGTTVPASTKINIKQATYTVTASRVVSLAGATTTPLWFSGYNTTPGDLDNDITDSLSMPIFAFNATFQLTSSGAHQIWTSVSISGSRTGTVWTASSTSGMFIRCRSENTSSNAGAIALSTATNTTNWMYCWFKCPVTATTTGVVSLATTTNFVGCVADTGGIAGFNAAASQGNFTYCIGINNTGSGFLASTGVMRIVNCTVYNSSSDCIKWSGTPAASLVVGCLMDTNAAGYGINNASGANTNLVVRACNDFHAMTAGAENGFGDSPAFFGQTDSGSVVTSSTNMTPVIGSNAIANGFPGIFENQSYSSYLDIGAVQHQVAAASGYVPQVME